MTPSDKPDNFGLPEGVKFLRFGIAGDDDFQFVGGFIFKGKRQGGARDGIVRPEDGYTFQPAMLYDIHHLEPVPGPEGTYMAVKQSDPVEITATFKFSVTNGFDEKLVRDTLGALMNLPGFVSRS